MSIKNLSELEWKKFAKGKTLEDKEFIKSLGRLETAARGKNLPDQLEALEAIEKQAGKLRSANKADKELVRYLDEADKEIASERKLLEMQAKAAARQAEAQSGEDEEGPAALTTKLVPVMRQVPKSEVPLPAMVAAAGKQVAVLVSRKAIGASQKKLLTETLGVSSGVKFMPGVCIWEANAHTFVLEAKVSNLAKLVKAALMEQTGLRFKVRVRGADPHDVDDDGEAAEGVEGTESEATDETPQDKAPEHRQLVAALTQLTPRIQQAVTAQPARRQELLAGVGVFQGHLKSGQFAQARQVLAQIVALLKAVQDAGPGSSATGAGAEAPRKPARPPARPVSPIWEDASEKVLDQATSLAIKLRGLQDPEADRMADDLLDTVGEYLSAVGETLEEYDGASAEDRSSLATEARDFLRDQQSDIAHDRLIAAADRNPLQVRLDLRRTMDKAIDEIAATFEA